MPRAPRKCAKHTCENRITPPRAYCPEHTTPGWEKRKGTSRTATTAHKQWRTHILDRDSHTCQLQHPGCTGYATEADHITPIAFGGPPTDPNNGQAVCRNCHKKKTAQEALAGRRRRQDT